MTFTFASTKPPNILKKIVVSLQWLRIFLLNKFYDFVDIRVRIIISKTPRPPDNVKIVLLAKLPLYINIINFATKTNSFLLVYL